MHVKISPPSADLDEGAVDEALPIRSHPVDPVMVSTASLQTHDAVPSNRPLELHPHLVLSLDARILAGDLAGGGHSCSCCGSCTAESVSTEWLDHLLALISTVEVVEAAAAATSWDVIIPQNVKIRVSNQVGRLRVVRLLLEPGQG